MVVYLKRHVVSFEYFVSSIARNSRLYFNVLYIQPDLHIKHGAYGTGYPQVNQIIHCNDDGPIGNGQSSNWMVTGDLF